MRLINTTTLQLEQFMVDFPAYAILSHTWGEDEITFQDFTNPDVSILRNKKGFAKVQHTCRQAGQDGLGYAWVDTCCIDKTSSAELSEAINSMFAWYSSSTICYAFLADLGPGDAIDDAEPSSAFSRSRWFTRGWTLQELIAPKEVLFYDRDWSLRGTKARLSQVLSTITGINVEVLRDNSALYHIPVARRMSWAASRQTTRTEDIAYSLLGIFDVSMPMLYGEGEKAFARLQEEIAKETNDLSLLAWKVQLSDNPGPEPLQKYRGILARSPAEFAGAGEIVAGDDLAFNEEFVMTNKGLRIKTGLQPGPEGSFLMSLNCTLHGDPQNKVGIYLRKQGASLYARERPDELVVQSQWRLKGEDTLYISKRLTPSQLASVEKNHSHAFIFRSGVDTPPFTTYTCKPSNLWDSQRRMFLTRGLSSFMGSLSFSATPGHGGSIVPFIISCRLTSDSNGDRHPWVTIADWREHREVYQALSNLKLSDDVGVEYNNKTVKLNHPRDPVSAIATVKLETSVLDGEPVYYIDLISAPE